MPQAKKLALYCLLK